MSYNFKLLCAAFCAAAWLPLAAQQKIDVTDEYLSNPSFEEGTTALAEGENVILGGGGGSFNAPDGWAAICEVDGWKDMDIKGGAGDENLSQVTDGERLLNIWSGTLKNVELSQTLTNLPNGTYTLTADMMTSEEALGASRYGTQRIFAIASGELSQSFYKATDEYKYVDKDENHDKDASAYGPLITVELTVEVTDGTLTVGFGTGNGGKTAVGGTGFLKIDNVRLYRVSTDSEELIQYLSEQIDKKVTALNNQDWSEMVPQGDALYITGDAGKGIVGLTGRASELAAAADDIEAMSLVLDSLNLWYNKYDALSQKYSNFVDLTYNALAMLDEVEKVLYADYDAFSEWVIEKMVLDVLDNVEAHEADVDRVNAAYPERYRTFLLSQEASAANPADFTAVISVPNFTKPGGDISVSDDNSSAGWEANNSFIDKGDAKLKTIAGQNCWNSWSGNFISMEVFQELNNLPEGLYSITAETTTNGIVNDQHAFAASTIGTAVSAPPSAENCYVGSDFDNEASWETLTTGKVLVTSDGKLKIGMASTSGGETSGWFCVTKFRLYYYGKENLEESYKAAFEARVAYAETLVDNEMLPSEKNVLESGITVAKAAPAATVDEIEAATVALNEAIETAETGHTEYTVFKAGNYKKVEDLVMEYAVTEGYENLAEVLGGYLMAVEDVLASDTTTMAAYVQLNSDLSAYLDFTTYYTSVYAYAVADGYETTAQETYAVTLAENVALLKSYDVSDIQVAQTNINAAIRLLKDYSAFEGEDVTFWIANPSFEDAPFANGWTNNGFKENTAQVAADTNLAGTKCAEQWTGSGGKLGDIQISQAFYVPNGVYNVSVAMKALQQGKLYTYAEDGATKTDSVGMTDRVKGVFFYANDAQVEAATPMISDGAGGYVNQIPGDAKDWPYAEIFTLENVIVHNNVLELGVKTESTTANWIVMDDFKLSFVRRDDLVSVEDIETIVPVPVAYAEGATIKVDGYTDFTVKNIAGINVRNGNLIPGIYFVEVPGFSAIKVAVK